MWSFAVARFARVYPLYLLAIAYIACKSYVVTGAIPLSLPWHILGLQAWLPDLVDAFAFGPSWSISVEVFLYASLPVLALSLRHLVTVRGLVVATVLTIVVMVLLAWWFQYAGRATLAATDAGSAHHWLYRMPLTRLGDFLLGIFAARIYVNVRERPHMDKAGAILAAVGLLSLLFFTTQFWLSTSAFRWDVAYAVPSDLLILGVALSPTAALARFLALPAIVLLGEASYAFYLVHATVAEPLGAGAWAVRVTAGTLSLEAMILGLILAMAIGIHIGVERPSRVWIRRMLDHGRPPAARTPLLRYYG
ncbi:MAG: hypothetical protein QOH74_1097 [Gaiellales bacterium]|nr:hypothetical protein [Gaiellales bacterium]